MKRSLVILLSSTALIAACGKSKDSGAQSGTSNISSVVVDTQLNASDLEMLANADVDDAEAELSNSAGSASALQSALNNVGGLSAAVSNLASCSTSTVVTPSAVPGLNTPSTTDLTVNCPSVTGLVSVTNSINPIAFSSSSDIKVNLSIAAGSDSASINRETQLSSIFFSGSASRTVNDSYTVAGNTFAVSGSSSVSSSFLSTAVSASATYSVVKNAGTADTVTVKASSDLHYTAGCGLDGGSLTYTSSTATYTMGFGSCAPWPAATPPPLPPTLPIILPTAL